MVILENESKQGSKNTNYHQREGEGNKDKEAKVMHQRRERKTQEKHNMFRMHYFG